MGTGHIEEVDPEEIVYYSRQWIYPENKFNGSHYIAEVRTSHYTYAGVTLADGNNSFYFDLDYDTEQVYNESLSAIEVVISGLEEVKKQLAAHREIWVAGEEQREAERNAIRKSFKKSEE